MADYNLPAKSRPGDEWYRTHGGFPIGDVEIPLTDFEVAVRKTYKKLEKILLSKHSDYGSKNISDSPGGPMNGLRVRIHDKIARINNLMDRPSDQPQHEPLEDSFMDLANYAIIALLVMNGEWDKK
jgi:hypothetical protein